MPSVMVTFAVLLSTALLPSSSGLCSHPGGSSNRLAIHSRRNESGHWVITVDTLNAGRGDSASRLSAIDIEQVTVNCEDEERMHLQTSALMRELNGNGGVTKTSGAAQQTIATSRPAAIPQAAVPEGYENFPQVGRYYKVHKEAASWENARTKCREEGADLMVIASNEELLLARELYNRENSEFFIGLRIHKEDNKFYTVKGDLVDGSKYSLWHDRHSLSEGGDMCAVIDRDGMCDRGCTSEYPFVCQVDG